MTGDVVAAVTVAAALAGELRWLRIAQREHYIAGSVTRFAVRWWNSRPMNRALGLAAAAGLAAAWAGLWAGTAAVAVISLAAPAGLSYRGASARLAWTRRLRTLAAITAVLTLAAGVAAAAIGGAGGAIGGAGGVLLGVSAALAVGMPCVTDLALAGAAPIEGRLAGRFVRSATRRLTAVSPRVVAITGSYGKTSTKGCVGHLIRDKYVTLTSPASFNNLAGLSRAINEGLAPGTEVFVAEMGTYGQGEIRALCDWLRPEIAVITAIGPAHLERMGSLDNIARAKAEILERAQIAVLNVDYPRLAVIAEEYLRRGGRLIRCSTADPSADVYVAPDGQMVAVAGRSLGTAEMPGGFPANLACAIGVAVAMDIPESDIAARLAELPQPPHRQTILAAANGVIVIDDTYNSNPEGCAGALATLASVGAGQRRVVVTPGMVELGRDQFTENETFARQAASTATDILVVGRTNQRAILRGAAGGSARVRICANRAEAVAWVRRQLDAGDAVLYENDLPDHYP